MPDPMAQDLKEKAKRYSHLKYGLAILDIFCLIVFLLAFLASGLPQALARFIYRHTPRYLFTVPLNLLVICLGYFLISLPLNFYRSYFLEHRFCLSTQKLGDWLTDQFKAGAISYIIILILLSGFYYILAISP